MCSNQSSKSPENQLQKVPDLAYSHTKEGYEDRLCSDGCTLLSASSLDELLEPYNIHALGESIGVASDLLMDEEFSSSSIAAKPNQHPDSVGKEKLTHPEDTLCSDGCTLLSASSLDELLEPNNIHVLCESIEIASDLFRDEKFSSLSIVAKPNQHPDSVAYERLTHHEDTSSMYGDACSLLSVLSFDEPLEPCNSQFSSESSAITSYVSIDENISSSSIAAQPNQHLDSVGKGKLPLHEDSLNMNSFVFHSISLSNEPMKANIKPLSFDLLSTSDSIDEKNSPSSIAAQPNQHSDSVGYERLPHHEDTLSMGSVVCHGISLSGDLLKPNITQRSFKSDERFSSSSIPAKLYHHSESVQNDAFIVPSPIQPPYWDVRGDCTLNMLDYLLESFNVKQYKRFLKRRILRTALGTSVTKKKTTFKYESRQRHAKERPRGPNGKFLPKEDKAYYNYKDLSKEDTSTAQNLVGRRGNNGISIESNKCGIKKKRTCEEGNMTENSTLNTSNNSRPEEYRIDEIWPAMKQKCDEINRLYYAFCALYRSFPMMMPTSRTVEQSKEKKKECDESISRMLRLRRINNQFPILEEDIRRVAEELVACRAIYLQKDWNAVQQKLRKMGRRENSNKSQNTSDYKVCYNCSLLIGSKKTLLGKEKNRCQCLPVSIKVPLNIWKDKPENDLKQELLWRFKEKVLEKSKDTAFSGLSTDT